MRNVTKLLCVVLALVIALSAASCSLTKQSSYQDDEIDLPVGVYIYYLKQAYDEAESMAQKEDGYKNGKYNGKTSFLKMEITDSDGETVVAEDWIKNKASEDLKNAIAIAYEANKVGATVDEVTNKDYMVMMYPSLDTSMFSGDYYDEEYPDAKKDAEEFEKYGIGYEAWKFCVTLYRLKEDTLLKEYGEGGPNEISKDELTQYFTDNFSSYTTISANLYTSIPSGDGTDGSTNVALSEDEIKQYEDAFKTYAEEVNDGKSMEDIAAEYQEEFGVEVTPKSESRKIDKDTEVEVDQAILSLKDGEATYKIIGEDDSRMIFLILKTPAKDKAAEYIEAENNLISLIKEMKGEEFDDLLKNLIEEKDLKPSSACDGYKPSMFEKKKK